MATINKQRILALHGLGFIKRDGQLSDAEKMALHRSAITINDIVRAIAKAGVNGANAEQVSHQCSIGENTVFTYCRELEDLGYINTHGERTSDKRYGMENIYTIKDEIMESLSQDQKTVLIAMEITGAIEQTEQSPHGGNPWGLSKIGKNYPYSSAKKIAKTLPSDLMSIDDGMGMLTSKGLDAALRLAEVSQLRKEAGKWMV